MTDWTKEEDEAFNEVEKNSNLGKQILKDIQGRPYHWEALAQPEPVKIAHKHEWFRTGEMKVGQMRCISCGTWGQEEMPQRTWVGLTNKEANQILSNDEMNLIQKLCVIEAKLKEKNA